MNTKAKFFEIRILVRQSEELEIGIDHLYVPYFYYDIVVCTVTPTRCIYIEISHGKCSANI